MDKNIEVECYYLTVYTTDCEKAKTVVYKSEEPQREYLYEHGEFV